MTDLAPRRTLLKQALRLSAATVLLPPLAVLSGCGSRAQAPDFSYTALDGRQAHSEALRGQVVIVSFWATSCGPCVRKMPELVQTHQRFHARGLQTLAVAMPYDAPARVLHFAQTRELPFEVVIDPSGAVARAFGDVQQTPTTFVIDRQGAIARRIVGEPDFPQLHTLLERLLAHA